jgi:CBS domain-containing protein
VGGAQRPERRLSSVARPISEVPTSRPDEDLAALIERVGAALENRVLVFDQGQLVGILSPVDIARLLTVRQTVGSGPAARRLRGPDTPKNP